MSRLLEVFHAHQKVLTPENVRTLLVELREALQVRLAAQERVGGRQRGEVNRSRRGRSAAPAARRSAAAPPSRGCPRS